MSSSEHLLHPSWMEQLTEPGLPTGLAELDRLTGGLAPGRLWLLLATPGAGRTTLACQLAMHAAVNGKASAAIITVQERTEEALANMLCARGRLPHHLLLTGGLDTAGQQRLHQASHELAAARLRAVSAHDTQWQFDRSTSVPRLNVGGPAPAEVLVVDDVDLLVPGDLLSTVTAMRRWCIDQRMALVLTVPEELALDGGRLRPELRRQVDVALRLHREDQFEPDSVRAGEADLDVLAHRRGPVGRLVLAFQGHYRRFVCLT